MNYFAPLIIHEQGLRENNEDAFRYGMVDENTSFYVVCDGVGGTQKGEVASMLACNVVADHLKTHSYSSILDYEQYIKQLVECLDQAFDHYIAECPEAKGMGTTLVLLILFPGRSVVAHIGDSRIYHVRNDQILYQSRDHSLLNELLDNGIISEEETESHPLKNVILRAVQGASVKRSKADSHVISQIAPGDYFFLCTDGILEGISSYELVMILDSSIPDTEKVEEIKKRCMNFSRDNYTALLVPIH